MDSVLALQRPVLRPAFRPQDQVCALRTLVRHRQQLVEMAAQHVQHMHQSMTQMNLQLQRVISNITGSTGLAIVDAILAGEQDPKTLAQLLDSRIRASQEVIEKSLCGNWREEHLFTLGQSRRSYGFYNARTLVSNPGIWVTSTPNSL